ncbi:MAG: hypothetical protein ACRDOH_11215, partial [Streptosporangiaceae bacterium]
RAAGLPAGPAEDAARDTLALEVEHGAGLRILTTLLAGRRHLDMPRPDLAAGAGVTVQSTGHLLLIARPLAGLACADPSRVLRVTGAGEGLVMAPALITASETTGAELCLSSAYRGCVAHVSPSGDGAALWLGATPAGPVTLELRTAPASHPLPAHHTGAAQRRGAWSAAARAGVYVEHRHWDLLTGQSSRYLV